MFVSDILDLPNPLDDPMNTLQSHYFAYLRTYLPLNDLYHYTTADMNFFNLVNFHQISSETYTRVKLYTLFVQLAAA
jgi:hypothetical protein